jgi:ABC-type Fe3+-hydroxamate transport system substrate-binding protein
MTKIKDALGQSLSFRHEPQRIVSLVPSLTQTFCDAGLENRLKGVTKFCVHPGHIRQKATVIGGTKNPRTDDILRLNPDFIVANKEENRREDIETLAKHCPVYTTDIKTLSDFSEFCTDMSSLFKESSFATIKESTDTVIQNKHTGQTLKVCYLIWKDPYMTVGQDTYIHHMMAHHGFDNVFDHEVRYPEINEEDIQNSQADFVFLSSEPYPFKDKDINELRQSVTHKEIILVDGEMFSWYGSAISKAHEYLSKLFLDCVKNIS